MKYINHIVLRNAHSNSSERKAGSTYDIQPLISMSLFDSKIFSANDVYWQFTVAWELDMCGSSSRYIDWSWAYSDLEYYTQERYIRLDSLSA